MHEESSYHALCGKVVVRTLQAVGIRVLGPHLMRRQGPENRCRWRVKTFLLLIPSLLQLHVLHLLLSYLMPGCNGLQR